MEALVASAILASVLAFAIGAYLISAQAGAENGPSLQAAYLADEGIEALRVMRDTSYSANIAPLAAGTTYYLAWNGTTWTSTTTDSFVDGTFERSFVLSNVYRNPNEDISTTGTLDPNTKEVTVTIAWQQQGATTTRTLAAYITNFLQN